MIYIGYSVSSGWDRREEEIILYCNKQYIIGIVFFIPPINWLLLLKQLFQSSSVFSHFDPWSGQNRVDHVIMSGLIFSFYSI